jgi:hypothetical protein
LNIPIFLERVSKQGLKISFIDGQIKVVGSRLALNQQIVDEIKEHKSILLRYFNKQETDSLVIEQSTAALNHESNSATVRQYTFSDGRVVRVSNCEFQRVVRLVKLLLEMDNLGKQS